MGYTKMWAHLVWATKKRDPVPNKDIRKKIFLHIKENALTKNIHIDFINGHVYEFLNTGFYPVSETLGSFQKFKYIPEWDAYFGLNNRAIDNGWVLFKPGALTLLT